MKTRITVLVLMLSMLLGVFGCTVPETDLPEDVAVGAPNFIGGNSDALDASEMAERPANLLDFAMTDENGTPMFQIVYKMDADILVRNACNRLADDIKEITGVSVPVVHSSAKQKTYEILIGDVSRIETIDVLDQYDFEESNFVIRAVDTRLIVYARNDQSTIMGLTFLTDMIAYRNEMAGEYGVAADVDYFYQPNEHPPVKLVDVSENYVEFALQNTEVMFTYARLSFTGNGGWRIQTKVREPDAYNDTGAAQRLAYSLGEEDPSVLEEISALEAGETCTVTASDGSRVEINLSQFRMSFYTPDGGLAAEVTNLTTYDGGSSITGVLEEDEAIFGTGERFDDANQRGKYIEMFTKDIWSKANACYMVIPLLCSSRGSGVFVNLYEHMTMDLGKSKANEWTTTVTGVPLDVYIFTTEQIADVIKAYSDLTGYAEMPEEWTYGMIVCSISPELSQKWTADITPKQEGDRLRGEGVYEMIANMEKYDLPWTGVLAEAWGPYRSAKHEDLKELCDYVHALGKKFMVYVRVGEASGNMITNQTLATTDISGFQSSYLLTQTRPDGTKSSNLPDTTAGTNNPDVGSASETNVYLDITNPNAVEWFFDEYWTYLMNDIGVDGCKIDFCETLPENYELNYYDESMPTGGSHHWYPTAFCAMFWNLISSKPDSGMCYTRGGGIGSQRSPYIWAGDQKREFISLGYQLNAVLSSGLSGVPFMSYDMSGYHYGYYEEGTSGPLHDIAYESHVFLRGTQFTAFTICMQTHGRVRRAYVFANEDPAYTYVTEIYRAYTKLHEHLTPYITELSEVACTTGIPVMRHLILAWQNDKNVYDIDDEYMFGDAFLIAPILDETNVRDIYLPEGEWIDLNTGEEYSVGAEGKWLKDYSATIAELPTFYNKNTESNIAPTLVDGIMELYDYARTLLPAETESSYTY
ncbi:MAG: glycoside hydrolase family 31 protein [Clostridia bacterium]|nr:glycoside hydrolase family 31 protein [Clostridia bacterium]